MNFTNVILTILALYVAAELGAFLYLLFSPTARARAVYALRSLLGTQEILDNITANRVLLFTKVAAINKRTKFIRGHQKAEAELVRRVTGRTIRPNSLTGR
jgi:hypothetical protein